MHCTSFRRASGLGSAGRLSRRAWWLGCCSAIPTFLVLLIVGGLVDLLLHRDGSNLVHEGWMFQSLLGLDLQALLGLKRYDHSFLTLLASLLAMALVEWLLIRAYFRTCERASFEVTSHLQALIFQQVWRLGPGADNLGENQQPEKLLSESVEVLRCGLADCSKVVPRAISVSVVLVVFALILDFYLSQCAALLAIVGWRVYGWIDEVIQARAKPARNQAKRRLGSLLDLLHTARTSATLSDEPLKNDAIQRITSRYREPAEQAAVTYATLRPSLLLLTTLSVAWLILVIGLSRYTEMTEVIVLGLIFARVSIPLGRLLHVRETRQQADEAAECIFAFLDQTPPVGQVAGAETLRSDADVIRLDHVCSNDSNGHPVLADVSFELPSGSRVAVVTTDSDSRRALVHTLLRYHDPDAGNVYVGETNLRAITLDSLKKGIVFVPGDGLLATGSIMENIVCARPDVTREQVEKAAKLSLVLDAIEQLPQSFQTTVGPLGRNLTPLVAFQIGLARALVSDPLLLVVEEPNEVKDDASLKELELTLQSVAQNRTLLVFNPRLSTLREATTVQVLHKGKIVAQGTHAALLQDSALYRHLNYLYFNPFRDISS